jgi:hypothetical protein
MCAERTEQNIDRKTYKLKLLHAYRSLWVNEPGKGLEVTTKTQVQSDEFTMTIEVIPQSKYNPIVTYRWVYIPSEQLIALIQTWWYDPRTQTSYNIQRIITRQEFRMMTPEQRQLIYVKLEEFAKEHGIPLSMTMIIPEWIMK